MKQMYGSCGSVGGGMDIGLRWLNRRKERLVRPRTNRELYSSRPDQRVPEI
jgi:hypothetical protein